ncbi:MAG TPA: malto-oligosyltrehalose synthase [Reyranella sp.]|nr:malto-oligosyltrehalose synthase [Reyranella sp.]
MTPRGTLRLQFHKGFTFADAEALVPYFAALGISHLYASPITTARPGSMHGYDVTDPTQVNPELGGEPALRRLVDALRREKLGLIVDIVPNHMAATLDNAWWADVLAHGRDSRYALWFDIDWESEDPELRGKVFLPWLTRPRHEVEPCAADALGLPKPGAYRLGWWRASNDRINWRRFFDINDLVCLRMENEEVFEAEHALIARLYAEGAIDGVRVDHVDGLAGPGGYCRALRRRLDPQDPARPYLVVEKILLRGETLAADWGCDGTTGYDFMDEVSALQHDPDAQPVLAEAWGRLTGRPADFALEEQAARREIIARSFSSPLEGCIRAFEREFKADPAAADLTRPALRRALTELLVHFPVYRGYGTPTDRPFLQHAAEAAKVSAFPSDRWVIDLLQHWLAEPGPATTRFQQLSAPVAAKSVEDTAFYRHGVLLSRNDVGFDVGRFGWSAAEFHARMQQRAQEWPRSLLATATHDHKRGEDVRARLAVLSERPHDWNQRLARWMQQTELLRTGARPARADIAMLLQTIVGAWPLELAPDNAVGRAAFVERLAIWQQKALREAKLWTDWADPNEAYETAARDLLHRLMIDDETAELRTELYALVEEIAAPGAINGLAQTLLRLTVPGVPDLYQGTELWDLSLVDPDNRRPVDFARRQQMLRVQPSPEAWRDGAIKQALIVRALRLREIVPDLFARGSYEPIGVDGRLADHVVAFLRRHGSDAVLVAVPRLPADLRRVPARLAFDPEELAGTSVALPAGLSLFNVLEDDGDAVLGPDMALQHAWRNWPVALFSTRRPFPKQDLPRK